MFIFNLCSFTIWRERVSDVGVIEFNVVFRFTFYDNFKSYMKQKKNRNEKISCHIKTIKNV